MFIHLLKFFAVHITGNSSVFEVLYIYLLYSYSFNFVPLAVFCLFNCVFLVFVCILYMGFLVFFW